MEYFGFKAKQPCDDLVKRLVSFAKEKLKLEINIDVIFLRYNSGEYYQHLSMDKITSLEMKFLYDFIENSDDVFMESLGIELPNYNAKVAKGYIDKLITLQDFEKTLQSYEEAYKDYIVLFLEMIEMSEKEFDELYIEKTIESVSSVKRDTPYRQFTWLLENFLY